MFVPVPGTAIGEDGAAHAVAIVTITSTNAVFNAS